MPGFGIVCTLMVELQICTKKQGGRQSRVGFLHNSIQYEVLRNNK